MKYTESHDGVERASVQVIVRLSRETVADIKERLKHRGEPYDDKGVRDYVNSCTEFLPPDELEDT